MFHGLNRASMPCGGRILHPLPFLPHTRFAMIWPAADHRGQTAGPRTGLCAPDDYVRPGRSSSRLLRPAFRRAALRAAWRPRRAGSGNPCPCVAGSAPAQADCRGPRRDGPRFARFFWLFTASPRPRESASTAIPPMQVWARKAAGLAWRGLAELHGLPTGVVELAARGRPGQALAMVPGPLHFAIHRGGRAAAGIQRCPFAGRFAVLELRCVVAYRLVPRLR